jgi:alkaline phosphatase D
MYVMVSSARGREWTIGALVGMLMAGGCVSQSPQNPQNTPAPVADAPVAAITESAGEPDAVGVAGADNEPGRAAPMNESAAMNGTNEAESAAFMIREYPRRPVAATFEVGATSALIWAYAPEPTDARIELEYAGPYRPGLNRHYERVSIHALRITAARGNTGVQRLDGLQRDGVYRYRLQFGNGDGTDWYHLRTAPAADVDAPVHFVFGADISNDPKYASPMLATMSRSGAAFFISLGDWPYTDLPVRDTRLEQYRASHRLARLQADTRQLTRVLPMYAIYDDHELHNDWDRVFVEERQKRALAGLRAWDEFFPVSENAEDPLTRRRYRTWQWGKHAQFFMLDARRYRSPYKDPNGPDKTMLGREQWDWLLAGLRASRATFKIIITSVPMDFGTTREHWNAYPDERDALYGFIADSRISGVVFLTGDQHWLSVHDLPSGHREYQVGPLRAFMRKPPDPPATGVLAQIDQPNYGEIVITPGPRPQLVFTARDDSGALLYLDVIRPVRGQRPPTASDSADRIRPKH